MCFSIRPNIDKGGSLATDSRFTKIMWWEWPLHTRHLGKSLTEIHRYSSSQRWEKLRFSSETGLLRGLDIDILTTITTTALGLTRVSVHSEVDRSPAAAQHGTSWAPEVALVVVLAAGRSGSSTHSLARMSDSLRAHFELAVAARVSNRWNYSDMIKCNHLLYWNIQ